MRENPGKIYLAIGALALFVECANSDVKTYRPNVTCEQCYNITSVEQLLTDSLKQYKPSEILVIFDFNYTLMYPSEPCLHKNNIKLHEDIFNDVTKQLSSKEADEFLTQMKRTANQTLVNPDFPNFLKRHEGVNFLICSGAWKDNADIYLQQLSANGVSIKNNYGFSEFEFSEFKANRGRRPIYKNGLILVNRGKKGPVLKSFLSKLSEKPKLIIFVDNSHKKLDSVKELASTLPDIRFVIVEYLEYKTKNMPTVSADTFRKYWERQLRLFKQRKQ